MLTQMRARWCEAGGRQDRCRRERRLRPRAGMAPGRRTSVEVAGVRITSIDRVVYPDGGINKGEIVAYYDLVAP